MLVPMRGQQGLALQKQHATWCHPGHRGKVFLKAAPGMKEAVQGSGSQEGSWASKPASH